MNPPSEIPKKEPTPEQIEAALEAMHHGSPAAFDRLLDASERGSSGICGLFLDMTTSVVPNFPAPNISGYAIDRLLGAGGMGVVFAGEQTGTRRPVAVKVIRGGIGVNAPADRLFRREIDTLLRLRHPNIADLYDAGTTSDGSPFFAMEFVDGCTFKDRMQDAGDVDLRSETGRPALQQFVDICRAMNHAHQRGVIHCDLKPTNVMIASDGEPKVLDFGLSRLIDPDASTVTAASASHHLVGTLAYMSPEQVSGPAGELDIRSDVYSLGVMLYELLCRELPHRIAGLAIPAAMRAISDVEPKRPSTIRPALKGDLDAIVMKALEKDRTRRYQSAAELADDLERALRGEPIEARADRFYLLRRTIYRYRVQALVAVAFFAVLVTATSVSAWFWYLAQQEAKQAEVEAENARVVGATAFTAIGEIMDEVYHATQQITSDPAAMDEVEAQINRLLPLVDLDPRMIEMRAAMLQTQGQIAHARGDFVRAGKLFQAVIETMPDGSERAARAHGWLANTPGIPDALEHANLAIDNAVDEIDRCRAQFNFAINLYDRDRLVELRQLLDSVDCESYEYEFEELRADALESEGDTTSAVAAYRSALQIAHRLADDAPANIFRQFRVMKAHTNLAKALYHDVDNAEALSHANASQAIADHILWAAPTYFPAVKVYWDNRDIVTRIQLDLENAADAEISARGTLDWLADVESRPTSPPMVEFWKTTTLHQLGRALFALQRIDEAKDIWMQACQQSERHIRDGKVNLRDALFLTARLYADMERVSQLQNEFAEMDDYRKKLVNTYYKLSLSSPEVAFYEGKLTVSLLNAAVMRYRDGDFVSAISQVNLAESAVDRFINKGGPADDATNFRHMIASVRRSINKARYPQSPWPREASSPR